MAEPASDDYNGVMTSDAAKIINDLIGLGGMRVWSLVITIFGDAVAPRGGVVPATALSSLLGRLDIKPEAMRVALHRLVKDGWIVRQKMGRQSYYGLTASGETEFLTARKRIYANAPALTDPWKLLISTEELDERYLRILPNVYLGQTDAPIPEQAMVISGTVDALPDWVSDVLAPAPLAEDYAQLETVLKSAQAVSIQDPADAATLRIMMIHQWRRALLRHQDLPAAFYKEGWRGEACRLLVLELHDAWSAIADPWLDAAITGDRGLAMSGGGVASRR